MCLGDCSTFGDRKHGMQIKFKEVQTVKGLTYEIFEQAVVKLYYTLKK